VFEQVLTNLEDHDDPEQPGKEKPSGERGKRPIQRQGLIVDFSYPDAEIDRPGRDHQIDEEFSIRLRNEPQDDAF
jgi:hypothetical protein